MCSLEIEILNYNSYTITFGLKTRQSRIADFALGHTVVRESNNSNTTG